MWMGDTLRVFSHAPTVRFSNSNEAARSWASCRIYNSPRTRFNCVPGMSCACTPMASRKPEARLERSSIMSALHGCWSKTDTFPPRPCRRALSRPSKRTRDLKNKPTTSRFSFSRCWSKSSEARTRLAEAIIRSRRIMQPKAEAFCSISKSRAGSSRRASLPAESGTSTVRRLVTHGDRNVRHAELLHDALFVEGHVGKFFVLLLGAETAARKSRSTGTRSTGSSSHGRCTSAASRGARCIERDVWGAHVVRPRS